eukprot:733301_1
MSLRLFYICRADGRKTSRVAFNSMKVRHVSTSDLQEDKNHKRKESSEDTFDFNKIRNEDKNHKRKESSEDTFDFNKIRNEIRDHWLKSEAASPEGARTKA